MFPLGTVLLPGERLPLQVFEPRYIAMVDDCILEDDPRFGVVLISRGHEVGGDDKRTDVGTIARIASCVPIAGDRFGLMCVGEDRVRVSRWLPDDPYPRAEVELWPDEFDGDDAVPLARVLDATAQLDSVWRELAEQSGKKVPEFPEPDLPDDPSTRSFVLAAGLPLGDTDRHRVLSAPGPAQRLTALAGALDDVVAALRFRLQ
jgi:uncharacterized protein